MNDEARMRLLADIGGRIHDLHEQGAGPENEEVRRLIARERALLVRRFLVMQNVGSGRAEYRSYEAEAEVSATDAVKTAMRNQSFSIDDGRQLIVFALPHRGELFVPPPEWFTLEPTGFEPTQESETAWLSREAPGLAARQQEIERDYEQQQAREQFVQGPTA